MFDASVLFSTGKDELLETAMRLHDVAMKDEYFIKRYVVLYLSFGCSYRYDTENLLQTWISGTICFTVFPGLANNVSRYRR